MSHCAQSHETAELGLSPIEETTEPDDTATAGHPLRNELHISRWTRLVLDTML